VGQHHTGRLTGFWFLLNRVKGWILMNEWNVISLVHSALYFSCITNFLYLQVSERLSWVFLHQNYQIMAKHHVSVILKTSSEHEIRDCLNIFWLTFTLYEAFTTLYAITIQSQGLVSNFILSKIFNLALNLTVHPLVSLCFCYDNMYTFLLCT
jgi:hypothetical protein